MQLNKRSHTFTIALLLLRQLSHLLQTIYCINCNYVTTKGLASHVFTTMLGSARLNVSLGLIYSIPSTYAGVLCGALFSSIDAFSFANTTATL